MRLTCAAAATAGAVVFGLLAAATTAGAGTPPAATVASAAELAGALDLPVGVSVAGTSGDSSSFGVGSSSFNDFPRSAGNAQYGVLSTGRASELFDLTVSGAQPSTDFGDDSDPDAASVTLTVDQTTKRCLLVDMAMGTEERVHYFAGSVPSDSVSLTLAGSDHEYAMTAGARYFNQVGTPTLPTALAVNTVDYWHGIDDEFERQPGDAAPLLPAVTTFDHFSSVETYEVPLTEGVMNTVTLSVSDANNGDLDSVVMVDHVRLANRCSADAGASTGLHPREAAVIVGHRGVHNTLTIDLLPDTDEIERYDAAGNGWYPTGVSLRFRWYSASSSNCSSGDMSKWTAIPDADRQSYTPTVNERGRCLLALVTGMKDGHRAETFPSPEAWEGTLPIQDGVFTPNASPTITGPNTDIRVNDVLTATSGNFTPRPDSYGFEWFADGSKISGASGGTFTVTAAQAGKRIRVRVTAARTNFDSMGVDSAETSPVVRLRFTRTSVPTIGGTGAAGSPLTARPGSWEPWAPGDSFSYRWFADGEPITGATKVTYTPSTSMIGKRVMVQVTADKAGYDTVSEQSAPIAITSRQFASGSATITGVAKVGAKLKASFTNWSPSPSSRKYEWRTGSAVVGTSSSLTVPASAVGKRITLTLRGGRSGYATRTATVSTGPASAGALVTSVPTLSGSAKPGRSVRVSARWRPSGVAYRYQWFAGTKAIKGATKSSYTIARKFRGKKIRVRVTGTKAGYKTVARYSRYVRVAKK